jgi:hypothetical protein
MINWIRNKLHNFIFPQDTNELVDTKTNRASRGLISRGSQLDSRNGMSFTIHQANGGYVMEYSSYDEKTDRNSHNLHIITSEQDLGQGIAHVITLELLRK